MQQKTITYNYEKVVNIYVVYEITNFKYNNNPILTNALFGAIKITKNADIEKYKYSGYELGSDCEISYNHSSGGIGGDAIIFGVDMSSSTNTANKEKKLIPI